MAFVGFGSNVRVYLTLDEPGGLLAEFGQERVEVLLAALGLEHDGPVGFVPDPPGDGKSVRGVAGPGSEADALDSSLEDDTLSGDHAVIVVDDRTVVCGRERLCGMPLILFFGMRCQPLGRVHDGVSRQSAHRRVWRP